MLFSQLFLYRTFWLVLIPIHCPNQFERTLTVNTKWTGNMEKIPELWTKSLSLSFPPPLITSYYALLDCLLSSLLHPWRYNKLLSAPLHLQIASGNFCIEKFNFTLLQHYMCSVPWFLNPTVKLCSILYARKTQDITLLHHMKRETALLFDMIIK